MFAVNYYQRHLGDYAKDTKTLTTYEHGVYTLLLDFYYSEEGPFTTDDAAALCRPADEKEQAAVRKVLTRYFKEDGGCWRHNYADRVIQKAKDKAGKAASSASVRWGKAKRTDSDGNANASKTHSDGNASHKPLAINQENTGACASFEGHSPEQQAEAIAQVQTNAANVKRLREAGCPDASLFHSGLAQALADGLNFEELIELAALHVGKPVAYLVKAAKGRRESAGAGGAISGSSPLARPAPYSGGGSELITDPEVIKRRQAEADAAMRAQYPEMFQ